MTGTVRGYTDNYALSMLNFGAHNWHNEYNRNLQVMDSLLFAATGLSGVLGAWANTTAYVIGNRVTDPDSGSLWQCEVNHTSAANGTFAADRAANPSYWNEITGAPINRGPWDNSIVYNENDFVVDNYRYAVCSTTHTSNAAGVFDDDIANWEVLIDLSTVDEDPTLSDIPTLQIPAVVDGFSVSGHTTPGDGGACYVKRVGSAPSHTGYRQSGDGAYWEIVKPDNGYVPTRCFGEMGDGSDYTTEIQNCINFCAAKDCHVLFVGPQASADTLYFGVSTGFTDPPNFFGIGIAHNGNTHAATSTLTQNSGQTSPLLVVQGARQWKYGECTFVSAVDVSTLYESVTDLTDYAEWINIFGIDTQHSPNNVGLAIDPFLADGGASHTLLDPYPGETYHLYQSSDIRGYRAAFIGFNIAIANQLGNRQTNGDFIDHEHCVFQQCRYMYSSGNGQARNISFRHCTGNRIHTLFATDMHGDLNGRIAGGMINCSFAGWIGRIASLHGSATPGPFYIRDSYIEGLWRHFDLNGGGSGTQPIIIETTLLNHNHERVVGQPGKGKVPRNLTSGRTTAGGGDYATWTNGATYSVGNDIRDRETNLVWNCNTGHTAAASGTFAADRAANPSYWTLLTESRSIVPVYYDACLFNGLAEFAVFFQNFPIMKRGTSIVVDEYGYDDWANNTTYTRGQLREDGTDVYVCLVGHTSAGAGTFATDRAANPTYWKRVDNLFETANTFYNGYLSGTPRTDHGQDDDMWNGSGTFSARNLASTQAGTSVGAVTISSIEGRIVNYSGHLTYATYGDGALMMDRDGGTLTMVIGDGVGLLLCNHDGDTIVEAYNSPITADFMVPA